MPAHTSSASAICGIAWARTNETASILPTPVLASWSMSAIFAVAGTGSSFCSPSLGPTSRTDIRAGRSVTAASSLSPRSLARPVPGPLVVDRRDPLPPVPRHHGGPPGRVLDVERLRHADPPAAPDRPFGCPDGDRGVGRDLLRELQRVLAGLPVRHQPVDHAQPLCLVGGNLTAGEDQVSGPALTQPALRELGAAAAGHQADGGL